MQIFPDYLSAIDIYVQPSVNEGLSLSILEAMAAEKSVISTRVGSASEIIQDGISGILIPPNSSLEIEKAIVQMIDAAERMQSIGHERQEFCSTRNTTWKVWLNAIIRSIIN